MQAGTKKASTHTKDVATALPTRCISESSGGEDKMGWGEPKKSKKKKAGGMGGGWGGDSESQSDSGVEGNVMGWGGSAKQKERMTTDSDSDSMSLFQRCPRSPSPCPTLLAGVSSPISHRLRPPPPPQMWACHLTRGMPVQVPGAWD